MGPRLAKSGSDGGVVRLRGSGESLIVPKDGPERDRRDRGR